jgi:general secretion pathway protein G
MTRPQVRRKARPSASRHAFSLLELMLVVAIMGVLMAVVGYNVLGASEKAKRKATEATLRTISNALDEYQMDFSSPPPDLQTLVAMKPPKLKDQKLADGWGTALIYDPRSVIENQPYQLGSAGADKNPGTADDINVWTMHK